jgi:hypothetical protein
MTYLVQREKKEREEADKLDEEIEVWKKRVPLAESRGMTDLTDQARERVRQLVARRRELQTQLDLIGTEKAMLRRESRRPDGHEVAYAEELLRRWQESGLVDPDEAVLERQFDEINAEQALAEFKEELEPDGDGGRGDGEVVLSDPDAPGAPDSDSPSAR